MGGLLDAFKALKPWQIGVLVAVLVGIAGATYGVYALVSGSGQEGLEEDQQLIPVQYGNLVNQVSTNGSLVFPNRETLTFGTQGTVGEVLAEEGQQVEVARSSLAAAEEELSQLTGPDPLEVEAKQEQLAVAELSLAEAEEDLAELKGSVDPLEVALREADLASARLALETTIKRLEDATLRAPMAGVVSLVNVEIDQNVNANTPVVEVVDPTVVEVDGIVDEIDVLFIQKGARATVTMDALPGQVLSGTVSEISSAARSQQGVVSYPISIRLGVPEGVQLREGLSATASIVIREERNVLLVPQQALYGTFEQPVVRVMSNGRIEERPVVLGNSDDFWVVVREGLAEGDQVVMETTQAATGVFGFGGGFRRFQGQFPGALPGSGGGRRGFGGGQRQQDEH